MTSTSLWAHFPRIIRCLPPCARRATCSTCERGHRMLIGAHLRSDAVTKLGLQGGALDAEGGAINRENAGPLAGGRVVVEAMLEHEAARLPRYAALIHNGDLSYACAATSTSILLLLLFIYVFFWGGVPRAIRSLPRRTRCVAVSTSGRTGVL